IGVDSKRMLDSFPTSRKPVKESDPDRFNSLASYDVVVAFDADWANGLSDEQAREFNKWVYKDGGRFIFIPAPLNTKPAMAPTVNPPVKVSEKGYDDDVKSMNRFQAVTSMLPVQPAYSPKDDIKTTEAHRLVFPGANENMEFMRIDETLPKEQWKRGW